MWHSFARPDSIRELQVGFSAYHDVLTPGVPVRVGETILQPTPCSSAPISSG